MKDAILSPHVDCAAEHHFIHCANALFQAAAAAGGNLGRPWRGGDMNCPMG